MAQAKKSKKFFNVKVPFAERETQIQGYEISELDGKFLKYDLTRNLKGKNMVLVSKVSIKDQKAVAVPRSIELVSYFLRRMMRKGTNYVEDSFSAECKDSKVRIKPFLITRRKVSRAVRNALRKKAKEELTNYLKNKDSNEVFEDLISGHVQKTLGTTLKKTYPLSLCEIRSFKIENAK